jgi:hypothetical protein
MAKKPDNWDELSPEEQDAWVRRSALGGDDAAASPATPPSPTPPPEMTFEEMREAGRRSRIPRATTATMPQSEDVAFTRRAAQSRLFEPRVPAGEWPERERLADMDFADLQTAGGGNLSLPEVAAYSQALSSRIREMNRLREVAEARIEDDRRLRARDRGVGTVAPLKVKPGDIELWSEAYGKAPLTPEAARTLLSEVRRLEREAKQADATQERFTRMAEDTLGMKDVAKRIKEFTRGPEAPEAEPVEPTAPEAEAEAEAEAAPAYKAAVDYPAGTMFEPATEDEHRSDVAGKRTQETPDPFGSRIRSAPKAEPTRAAQPKAKAAAKKPAPTEAVLAEKRAQYLKLRAERKAAAEAAQ